MADASLALNVWVHAGYYTEEVMASMNQALAPIGLQVGCHRFSIVEVHPPQSIHVSCCLDSSL